MGDKETKSFAELSAELKEKDPEFRKLDEKCRELDERIAELDRIYYLTSMEDQELKRLRQLRIKARNGMYKIARRYEGLLAQ